jgi:hypothetical protein
MSDVEAATCFVKEDEIESVGSKIYMKMEVMS